VTIGDRKDLNQEAGAAHSGPGSTSPEPSDWDAPVIRHEEVLRVDAVPSRQVLRVRKSVANETAAEDIPRRSEEPVFERVTPGEGDSGQVETLPDGSISIPVLEEEIVVTKRVVVRERIIVRKEVHVERQRLDETLRVERVDIEGAEESQS
jgi:uncharacterized protein (TIGR02271 family)